MEMYEETVLNNELYEPFFPTYELKYLAMERKNKPLENFAALEVPDSEPESRSCH
jgi:hypothetical protein